MKKFIMHVDLVNGGTYSSDVIEDTHENFNEYIEFLHDSLGAVEKNGLELSIQSENEIIIIPRRYIVGVRIEVVDD